MGIALAMKNLRTLLIGAAIAAAVLVLWTAYTACVSLGILQPLGRPHGVPASARYVSTFKQETWFDCRVDLPRNVDVCRAWDVNGKLMVDGDFRLEDEERAATAAELRPSQVISATGHVYMIYLYGNDNRVLGRVLVPVVDGRRIGIPQVTTRP